MFLQSIVIDKNSSVSDIVKQDHRTADVFRKYGIEYCCGGRWPIETACMIKGLEFDTIKKELEIATRVRQLPMLPFDTWDVDFLTSYIVNIHHYYLKSTLPDTTTLVKHFADEHIKKYSFMQDVCVLIEQLTKEIIPHLQQEEETIFPYICQVAHAYENNDSYAKLLVKTLRKPLGIMMNHEHDKVVGPVFKIRELTDKYSLPEKACVSHKVALSRLQELDNDLMQHVYLENEILFPKAIHIEQELLK
ncbi:MAG: DUF542 domain-containing protein [Bacteroidota bacterium]